MKSKLAFLFTMVLTACDPGPTSDEQLSDLPCETVSDFHVSNILEGVNKPDRGYLRMESPQGVRSKDFERIYFVAGDLHHKQTNAYLGRGVWVMNNIGEQSSYYWAMPGPATEWTVYPDATQNKARISKSDHGYLEAIKCTRLTQELNLEGITHSKN